jgi:hypothetical protein
MIGVRLVCLVLATVACGCGAETGETRGEGDGGDSETGTGPEQSDCAACPAAGTTVENMACAIDLCLPGVVLGNEFASPTNAKTQGAYAAVERFGKPENDLAPRVNGSYALMASGPAAGLSHSVAMGGKGQVDPFGKTPQGQPDTQTQTYDVMEWRLHMRAPAGAKGFRITYVFFSEEYDEFVGTVYNDKFYIFLEAPSTDNGQRKVINYTKCRTPDEYKDFEDGDGAWCYVAINTALSECCWYNGCPDGKGSTSIVGTGYICAKDQLSDTSANGSSTGWLKTEWPIVAGEEFDLIFHIHDTSDQIYDSEVILDGFTFLGKVEPGTVPVE